MHIVHAHTALSGTSSHVHIDFKWPHLHTATIAPFSDLYSSQPSSQDEQLRGTQCVAQRSAHCRNSRHMHACCLCQCATHHYVVQITPDQTTSGSGLGLIWIGSRLGECILSVDAFNSDSIQFNVH